MPHVPIPTLDDVPSPDDQTLAEQIKSAQAFEPLPKQASQEEQDRAMAGINKALTVAGIVGGGAAMLPRVIGFLETIGNQVQKLFGKEIAVEVEQKLLKDLREGPANDNVPTLDFPKDFPSFDKADFTDPNSPLFDPSVTDEEIRSIFDENEVVTEEEVDALLDFFDRKTGKNIIDFPQVGDKPSSLAFIMSLTFSDMDIPSLNIFFSVN